MESSKPANEESHQTICHKQVGGHNPFIYMKDGRIAKPYSANERLGYEVLLREHSAITKYLAKYYGPYVLNKDNVFIPFTDDDPEYDKLYEELTNNYITNNETDKKDASNPYVHIIYPNRYLILSDVTHNLRKPCLIDIKMGIRHNASPEKILRHTTVASKTTTGSLGLRICGMKLYQSYTQSWIMKGKLWGRTLKSDDMLYALGSFFFNGKELRKNIIEQFIDQAIDLRDSLQDCYHRFYSSSLLLIYEGDDYDIPQESEPISDDSSDCSELNEHEYYCDTNFAYWKRYKKNNENKYSLSNVFEPEQVEEPQISPDLGSKQSVSNSSSTSIHNDLLHLKLSASNTSLSSLDTCGTKVPPTSPIEGVPRNQNEYPDLMKISKLDSPKNAYLCFIDLGNCNFTTKYDTPDDGYLFGLNNLIAFLQTLVSTELTPFIIDKFHN